MTLTVITPPANEPVSLVEAKAHLRVDHSDDDTYITSLITVAREKAETITRRALITQTLELTLDAFPARDDKPIRLRRGEVQSVEYIKYIDGDGVLQTWASASYQTDLVSEPARILPAYEGEWPTDVRDVMNAVTVRYDAGYGDDDTDVPQAIRQAMLLMIGHWYDHREDVAPVSMMAVPMASDYLLAPYRLLEFH